MAVVPPSRQRQFVEEGQLLTHAELAVLVPILCRLGLDRLRLHWRFWFGCTEGNTSPNTINAEFIALVFSLCHREKLFLLGNLQLSPTQCDTGNPP